MNIAPETYRQKVYGCWLGKNIGGTLGGPHEGKIELLNLTYYDPVPTGALANDDLDLQLIWLAALRAEGPDLDERDLGRWWKQSLQYPFDEYGIALWNLFRGVEPPVSGQFANHFSHCMGAPIRSEIWACIAPGRPDLAAAYAYADGCVDHGGEGIYGEMFFAALQSAAFVVDDRERLLDLGLAMIPADTRTAGAIRLTRECYAAGLDWLTARERILEAYGDVNFTDAPQNIAFTVLGWLWGESPEDGMCKAVNCGYDTDCTGATLGAILGLIHGPEVFDRRWVDPIGDDIVVGWGVHDCETPKTIAELTDWTLEVSQAVRERFGEGPALEDALAIPPALQKRLDKHQWTIRYRGEVDGQPVTAWLDLGGAPSLAPGESREIAVEVDGADGLDIACRVQKPWTARRIEGGRFLLTAPDNVQDQPTHELAIVVGGNDAVVCPFTFVPACGWQVAGPIPVDDAAAALADPPPTGEAPQLWTTDHRLVLDEGSDRDRLYRVRTYLQVSEPKDVRLVSATPELQRVWLDGQEVLTKTEPTRFIPAPHRSGPGTATEATAWDTAPREVELLVAARAGQPAIVHLYCTRSNQVDGPRLVPWADVVHRMP